MNPTPSDNGWSLEIVRGTDAGRLLPVRAGETILGNALKGEPGIDLADQEGTSPRRMAARQAQLECAGGGLAVRDLDSPGGTFVNRQRILPGQARPLREGDLLQLGPVQLRIVRKDAAPGRSEIPTDGGVPPAARPPVPGIASTGGRAAGGTQGPTPPRPSPPAAPARPGGAFLFQLKDGPACRSWDDFLTVSAQRWDALRDELTSGRLAAFLASIGRDELKPPAAGIPDERLDAWLGALPTTKSSQPELDVHPATLAVQVASGGGTTRRNLRVTNVGYRLLRATARVEPAGTAWLALPPEFAGRPFIVVDGTDLPLRIAPPDRLAGPLSAAIILDGNGGTRRVPVTLAPAAAREAIPELAAAPAADAGLTQRIARQSPRARVVSWGIGALGARALLLIGGAIGPGLLGPAELFAALGALAGAILAGRRGSIGDAPAGAFAGACSGVIVAAVLVASARAIEPATPAPVHLAVWALLGAAAAGASVLLIPPAGERDVRSRI